MFKLTSFRRQVSSVMSLAVLLSAFSGTHVNASQFMESPSIAAQSASVMSSAYSKIELAAASLKIAPSTTQTYTLTAYDSGGASTPIPADQVTWTADSSIGTISTSGVLTAPAVASGYVQGYVHASYEGLTTSTLVIVGNPVGVVLEDFESAVKNGKAALSAGRTVSDAVYAYTSTLDIVSSPVRFGNASAKLNYNYLGTPGAFGVFVSLLNSSGAAERPIVGTPKKIGVWVYGDPGKHTLRARLKAPGLIYADFTPTTGFKTNGWTYATATIPSGTSYKFLDVYLVEDKTDEKDAGSLIFDQLSLFYTDTTAFSLDIQGLAPIEVGQTTTASVYALRSGGSAPTLTTSGITYLSSQPDIAMVDSTGKVTGLNPGKTSIVAFKSDSDPAFSEVTVSPSTAPPIIPTKFELTSPSPIVEPGSTQAYTLTGYDANGNSVPTPASQVTWQADSSIGTISSSGVLTAAAVPSEFVQGYVHATYNGHTADQLVLVGNNIATVFEDFESLTKNGTTAISAGRTTSVTVPGTLPAGPESSIVNIATRPTAPVMYGNSSAKHSYDMTLSPSGTFGVYASLNNLDTGSEGRPFIGYPKQIGVWVYGDESTHYLRAQLKRIANDTVIDGKPINGALLNNTLVTVDFVPTTPGINWKGWRYVTANIPTEYEKISENPLVEKQISYRLMNMYVVEPNNTKKNESVVYYDHLSVFYTNTTTYGLDIQGLTPMQVGQTRSAQAFITKKDSTAPELTTSGVTYLSSRPDIATVDGNGQVTALKSGKTSIIALYADTQPAVYELTVSDMTPVVNTLELLGVPTIEASRTDSLLLRATYAGQTDKLNVTTDSASTITSSNTDVAIVENGKLRALSVGTSTITATFGGQTTSYLLTVIEPVLVLYKIQLANMQSLTIGDTHTANVNAIYNLLDLPQAPVSVTQGVTFKSSKEDVATIDASSGAITAVNVGVTLITATLGKKSATYSLVVNQAQSAPKREMRAAWVAAVENIDWPKKGIVNVEQQKQDFKNLLDRLAATGINAIITQVRPTSDALYPSTINPWSEWLTGTQGKDPGYDPLAFMIEEARKRNMEFHAWFNPYRISNDENMNKLAANSPAKLHPDWVVHYDGKMGYNPGIPAVKQYVIDSVMEVVKNYDIDGVHFDDYFYPYPVTGLNYPDSATFVQYGGNLNLGDWRRQNVDSLIQEISQEIKQEKPYVQFGISPFGIWRNKSDKVPNGSDTSASATESYNAIYADTLKWVQQGWIDYITPQLYWSIGNSAAYDKLVEWWQEQVKGRHVNLYTGNGIYKVGVDADSNWLDPEQIPNQIKYNRNYADVKGTMLFGATSLLSNPLGVKDTLQNSLFQYPALLPQLSWLDSVAPNALQTVATQSVSNGVQVSWNDAQTDTAYYVIYRAEGENAPDTNDPAYIFKQVRKQSGDAQSFVDTTAAASVTYTYIVTAVDRLHNESPASESKTITYIQPEADQQPSPSPGAGTGAGTATGNVQDIQLSDMQNTSETQVTVTVKPNVETIQLPANTASLIGGNKDLVLQLNNLSITIPSAVLASAESLISSNDSKAKLIFSVVPVTGEQLTALEGTSGDAYGANLKGAAVYRLTLTVQNADGTRTEIKQFAKPMSFTFTIPEGIDAAKAQVYYIADNGELTYVDSRLSSDKSTLTADISHFSTYGVFEFNKSYEDVANTHWAYKAVGELSRKLIVKGVDDHSFGPERSVTRAEFAALLVRALGLKEASTTSFQDVQASDWFAKEVAAALQAGIVTGMTNTTFNPNGTVSREQMAAMLVRAYLLQHPNANVQTGEATFTDISSVQEWAKIFVNQAAGLGLVTGREENVFAPAAILNRAESAQAIFNLLHLK
ncbi:family 10 glycosylhydrolase [Paenibacillus qinlingensis]|uniref:Uncharacterized lipoprotein YddW (UPF0748 family) n=1 Tax=Paenibacillus qinlingensis TaxID=1837343 RepID=A0ABU1P689_9BACL|nr:family 10 glycosylhydrolase [Paenibacillus qinlingensis]MDR6555267.1 uncharacterized lipoprotein YddW (UPF0748 family) [Paenibacillus qinlingensis]